MNNTEAKMSDCPIITCSRSFTVSTVMLTEWSIFVHTGPQGFKPLRGWQGNWGSMCKKSVFHGIKKNGDVSEVGTWTSRSKRIFCATYGRSCEATSSKTLSSSFLEEFLWTHPVLTYPNLWRICGSRQMGDVSLYLHTWLGTFPVTGSQPNEYSIRMCALN